MWFNNTNESCYYMIPGVIVIILSLIGCMLTSLQMAKEYEHGNMESMFVTPMTAGEILLAKMANNYLLGMIGLTVALLFSRYLFQVPIRGSIWLVLLGSSVFLMLQMALGLLISSITKNQFLACQIALVIAFLPVVLLSGFLYEIPNMPVFLQYFTCLVPARYYVDFLQTIFLVGNVPSNIIKNLCIMGVFSLVLLFLAKLTNPKRLGGG
jgi:ABC-2 type transport system permease protein